MGTRGGGLSRYDGVNFKTFSVNDGLVNNYISCIIEDKKNNLWIGTNNGLSDYNGIVFKNYQVSGDSAQVSILDIDIDTQGKKWLATNMGVLLFENNQFINISEQLKASRKGINTILADKNEVWYGSEEGLFKIVENVSKNGTLKFEKPQKIFNNSVTSIKKDKKGNIWIGTYQDGVHVFDGKKVQRVVSDPELIHQIIFDIYFDSHENIWFATLLKGVANYNTSSERLTWLTENEGLSSNHTKCITQDNSENFWFGTSGGGVCNYFGKQFTNYDKTSGLAGNFIHSIYRDSKNRLWIGTSDKGLTVLDSLGFRTYNSQNGFSDVKVKAIIEDNNGKLYFGTDGQGIFEFNDTEFKALPEITGKYIRSMVKDINGNIWIATAGTGIFKLSITEDENKFQRFSTVDGLLHNRVTCLHYDKEGRLWYATENDGIGLIINDKIQKRTITVKDGLQSNAIRSLTEDASGYLWIGTAGYGIASFPLYRKDSKIICYDFTKGLTSSNIYLLASDSKNNLFVGTESGLDYLTLDKERNPIEIKHYSKGEGFTGVETCLNSVFKDIDGTIWFGTINGLAKYNPANLVKNENEPITNINDVKLFYIPIANTDYKSFAGDWNRISNLYLPFDQNHITFDFTAINFSNPDAVRYQWKLEGFDEEWSPVSKNHSISYSNLGAGDYTFLVKACNEDGVWNKQPVKLSFHISAPFWLKTWFFIVIAILVLGLVYVIFKWRELRIKSKSAEEQKKLQLEKEVVELEQKALRLQMNPHFIFNAINSIQSQIGNDNDQVARYYLAKFARLMRQILDNSRSTMISLMDEVSTLENYLLIEKFCNDNRFDYKINVDPNIEVDFVKIPPMLLQPFIENAIKHGLKHLDTNPDKDGQVKRGMIEVEFKEINNILECSVSDNGVGRLKSEELNKSSKETYHKSTALLVTQRRLDLLKLDKDHLSLEIIDLKDEKGGACGTKVVLRLPVV
jgi:ligand-binding sensor domain-containing protein